MADDEQNGGIDGGRVKNLGSFVSYTVPLWPTKYTGLIIAPFLTEGTITVAVFYCEYETIISIGLVYSAVKPTSTTL